MNLGTKIPDAKTIWLFREELTKAGLTEKLFEGFNEFLEAGGFSVINSIRLIGGYDSSIHI